MKNVRRMGLVLTAGAAAMAAVAWRAAPTATQITPAAQIAESARVRTLPLDTPAIPGKKGSTYYSLEGRSTRVTARYDDGSVVVMQRGPDGALHARMADRGGNEVARLDVADTVRFSPGTGEPLQAVLHPEVRPTLAWAGKQVYELAKGGTADLTWQGGFMRSGKGSRTLEPRELETEWADGLTVKTTSRSNVRDAAAKGRVLTGDALSARLTRHGAQVALADWYPRSQVFRWTIPSLRDAGSIEPHHLEKYKGWPFVPDAEWLNLQLLAFYHFKTLINENGSVASRINACKPERSFAARLLNTVSPTVYANEPGCDNLHWLDGTIYRYCCDVHDWCYAKYGCTSRSWWQFWQWRCEICNTWVLWCFASGPCMFEGGINCI